jgi:hypothetical protein
VSTDWNTLSSYRAKWHAPREEDDKAP